MATVLEMMELYRTMMALLEPLEGAFGRAWQSVWAGGFPEGGAVIPDFFGEFTSRISGSGGALASVGGRSIAGGFGKIAVGGNATSALMDAFESPAASGLYRVFKSASNPAVPRLAAGYNAFGGFGAFDKAIGLPERPVRSDNGGFFYTELGDKGASGGIGGIGRTGRFGKWGFNFFPEKIRGGNDGSHSAGGYVLPDYGANLGMVLDNQLIGKQISGIGADGGDSGYSNFSGEFGNSGASGENRGSLYMNRTFRSLRTLRTFDNPENWLVPNARTEEFDLWKNTEHLRIADYLEISKDMASGERLAAVRGYAEREAGGYGGYRDFGGSNINIDMSSMKNIVNSKSDMDELIDRLCSAIGEAAFSMAEGVHS